MSSAGRKPKQTKKRKKDPNAPKRARSAYILFCAAKREEAKRDNPTATNPEIMQALARMWKSQSAEDKRQFEDAAAADKQRYANESANYVAPEDDDDSDSDAKPQKKKQKGKKAPAKKPKGKAAAKGKKKAKDPNAPKRARSAYIYYAQEVRPSLKADRPELTQAELLKEIGAMWNNLSESDKQPFKDKAAQDKQRSEREKAAYQERQKMQTQEEEESEEESEDESESASSRSSSDEESSQVEDSS